MLEKNILRVIVQTKNVSNFQNLCRHIQISSSSRSASEPAIETIFNEDNLLSPQRKEITMKKFQSLPRFTMTLPENTYKDRYAAVLMALCVNPETKEVSLLYTKRASTLKRHSGQVSFPGGVKDPGDKDFADCALREAEEEVGLDPKKVEIWGEGTMFTPPLTNPIMPVIGVVRDFNYDELYLNHKEVDEAFVVPIKKFYEPGVMGYTKLPYSTKQSPSFDVDEYKIWGVTGYLTFTFLHCFVPSELGRFTKAYTIVKDEDHSKL